MGGRGIWNDPSYDFDEANCGGILPTVESGPILIVIIAITSGDGLWKRWGNAVPHRVS